MIFLADENLDKPIVDSLRADGHTVLYVAEMAPSISDDAVLSLSNRSGAILLTSDKDFGELVFRLKRVDSGVILVRLAGLAPNIKARIVTAAVRQHGQELADAFSVISPGAVRIRRR